MVVLDLSNNNASGTPNFHALKLAGVTGIMLKVSEGATFVDPYFKNWARRIRDNGIRVGGYHFARPDGGDPLKEAAHFAKSLGEIKRRDFRPALDLESNPGNLSGDQLESWSRAFNLEVARLTGSLPMFYASTGWIKSMNFSIPIGAALWLANWSNNGLPFVAPVPSPWKHVHLHQYTSNGSISGIGGRVDLNQVVNLRPLLAHPLLGLV